MSIVWNFSYMQNELVAAFFVAANISTDRSDFVHHWAFIIVFVSTLWSSSNRLNKPVNMPCKTWCLKYQRLFSCNRVLFRWIYHEISGLNFRRLSNVIALNSIKTNVRNQIVRSKHLKKMSPCRLIITCVTWW